VKKQWGYKGNLCLSSSFGFNTEKAFMSKITSEQIKQALENYSGKIKKLKDGVAQNASIDGSICAASFGASKLGQARQRANYFKESKQKREIRKNRKIIKNTKKNTPRSCATEKQLRYLEIMGFKVNGKISKVEASNEIKRILRETEKMNRIIQKRIDLDE
jgi:hypothetical protein